MNVYGFDSVDTATRTLRAVAAMERTRLRGVGPDPTYSKGYIRVTGTGSHSPALPSHFSALSGEIVVPTLDASTDGFETVFSPVTLIYLTANDPPQTGDIVEATVVWTDDDGNGVWLVLCICQRGAGSGEGSGSGADAGGDGDRCTGTVSSIVHYRTECIEGVLYQYSWLVTHSYDDTGCVTVEVGEESSEEIGCCDCDNSDGGGGIGGDPETVVTECCDGRPLPKSIPVRVESTCAVYNGLTGFAVWDGEKWVKEWTIDCDANCTTLSTWLECVEGVLVPSFLVGPVPPCTFSSTEPPAASIDCGPPRLIVSQTTGTIAGGICCAGETFTIIWEESDAGGDGIDGGGP